MADQGPKHQAVELLRRTRGPDVARHDGAALPDPVDLRRDAAPLVNVDKLEVMVDQETVRADWVRRAVSQRRQGIWT